jgi:hypothetical protein
VFILTELWAQLVVGIIALILVVVLFFGFVLKRNPFTKTAKNKGRTYAKKLVTKPLAAFAKSNRFAFIAPFNVKRGDYAANLEGVVVGYFGILAVINLGYSGTVYGAASDDKWKQVAENGKGTFFENPINEASTAVRAIRDVLFAAKIKKVPVEVVYVFSHPKVQLALPRSIAPLKIKTYKKLLKKEKYMDDCGLDIEKVKAVLSEAHNTVNEKK